MFWPEILTVRDNINPQRVRITFAATAVAGLDLADVYVGLQALNGNPYDRSGPLAQLLFGGVGSVSIPAGGQVASDWVDLPWVDGGLVVSTYTPTSNANYPSNNAVSPAYSYYKEGNEADELTPAGVSPNHAGVLGILKIEIEGSVITPSTEPYDPSNWLPVEDTNPVIYNGITWGNYSVELPRSIALSAVEDNLVRFEVRDGDVREEEALASGMQRCELGSFNHGHINGGEEFYISFTLRGWGVRYAGAVIQIVSDDVEFQMRSIPGALAFMVFDSAGVPTVVHNAVPLRDGVVDQFVLRLRCRADGTGQVQVWRNGTELFNASGLSFGTDNPVTEKSPKYGMYRDPSTETSIVHTANWRIGADLSAKISSPDPLPAGW